MKIHDIISESQVLTEQWLIAFRQMLKYSASKEGQGIEHALEWIAGKLLGKGKAVDEMAEAWILTSEKLGITSDQAISMGSKAAREAGHADDVIKAAEEAARALAKKNQKSIWGQLKTPDSAGNFWWGAWWSAINRGLTWWYILEPVTECVMNISQAYKLREEGNKDLQDNTKLAWVVQHYIDNCVQRVVSTWLGNKIVGKVIGSWVPGVAYNIPIAGKLFQMLDPIYSKLTPPAQAIFKAWMISKPGQEALASWIVGTAMVPYTDWKIPGGPTYQKLVLDPLGGLVQTGYNHILVQMKDPKAVPLPKDPWEQPDKDMHGNPKSTVDRYKGGSQNLVDPSY